MFGIRAVSLQALDSLGPELAAESQLAAAPAQGAVVGAVPQMVATVLVLVLDLP